MLSDPVGCQGESFVAAIDCNRWVSNFVLNNETDGNIHLHAEIKLNNH